MLYDSNVNLSKIAKYYHYLNPHKNFYTLNGDRVREFTNEYFRIKEYFNNLEDEEINCN